MSYIDAILNATLTGIITSIILYATMKYLVPRMIEDTKNDIKDDIQEWLNTENGQKAIYLIGTLIGNGAKAGIGLSKGSGKFKMEDLIGQAIGSFLQGGMGGLMPQQQGSEQPQQTPQQGEQKLKFPY